VSYCFQSSKAYDHGLWLESFFSSRGRREFDSNKRTKSNNHVFQKDDGTGNFPDNATSDTYLTLGLVLGATMRFGDMCEMNLATTSPYLEDSRIRFNLDEIFYHQDDYGWELDQTHMYSWTYRDSIYSHYVTNNGDVTNKTNSVHVFLGETWPGHGISSADRRYVFMSGTYYDYNQSEFDRPKRLLAHELGHNLQLHHTWLTNDDCDDTPPNDNCWCEDTCSNNIMDYNCYKCALTECQVGKMHWALMGYSSNISDCYVDNTTYVSLPYSTGFESGPDDHWVLGSSDDCGLIRVTGDYTPHAGSAHLIMCSAINGNYATNTGELHLNLSGKSDVELEFYWKETGDETHTQDGVYISDDGGSIFKKIYSLTGGSSTYQKVTIDLSDAIDFEDMDHSGTFVIKFQQYDNYKMTTDGIAIDDINV